MLSNQKSLYIIIRNNIKLMCDSIMVIMEKDLEEEEYKILIKNILKNKKSINKLLKLISIIFFIFFH